jgi:hypothetical protein
MMAKVRSQRCIGVLGDPIDGGVSGNNVFYGG